MNTATKPDPAATPDFTQCPNWGQGGQYIYDPATGVRTRVVAPVDVPDSEPAQLGVDASQAVAETDVADVTIIQSKKEKQRA